MRSVNGRWGKVWFYGKDIFVGGSLFHYGEYGPEETEKILELAGTGLCLDIGANFGCISQALESVGHEVVAFEPQPDICKITKMNVRGAVYNCALGSEVGTGKMPFVLAGSKANYGGNGIGMRSDLGTIDVQILPLDSFVFEDVSFIKIDVEGYEEEVLRGGVELIKRCKPVMYIEDDRVEKSASLRKYIKELGYSIEEHHPKLFRTNNYFNNPKFIWPEYSRDLCSHNLICKPC